MHGLDNLQKLVSVDAINRFIFSLFANENFSRDKKAVLLRKWIALVLQVKFCFMGCLVKANALVSGNSIVVIITVNSFTKQPSAERYLANIFSPVFLATFRKFLQHIKKTKKTKNVLKTFRKFTKNTRCEVLF